jgi:hypothetical protein
MSVSKTEGTQIMPGQNAPINALRYVLSVDGAELVTYSELLELKSEVDPAPPPVDDTHTKTYGTVIPPSVTLRRALDGNAAIWAWHMAVLMGDPTARKTCSLQLMDLSGQVMLTFVLENAWLGTVQVTGAAPPPQPSVSMQTDTFTCDEILMQSP